MLDFIEKELLINNAKLENGSIIYFGNNYSIKDFILFLKKRTASNRKIIQRILNESVFLLSSKRRDDNNINQMTRNIFVESLKSIYDHYYGFEVVKSNYIESVLKESVFSTVDDFPFSTISKIIDHKLAIDWVCHCIKKDSYIISLLFYLSRNLKVKADGVMGMFSNLDLPMRRKNVGMDRGR